MKFTATTLLLLGGIYANSFAQGKYEPVVDVPAPLFRTWADTLSKPAFTAKTGEKLMVVAQPNARWFQVRRTGFDYYVPASAFAAGTKAGVDTGPTLGLTGPPVYAIAKTTSVPFKRTARMLTLDLGAKPPLNKPFYMGENGMAIQFETEAVVLNFLDSLGWSIIPNGQEVLPPAGLEQTGLNKKYEFDNVYLLKRK